jgi:hypothetical protein
MIRVAHLSSDRTTVVSVSIEADDWVADSLAVASNAANIGDTYNGTAFSPPLPPGFSLANELMAGANQIQQQIASGGITVNVGTSQAPVNVKAATDPASLTLLLGAYSMAQANSGATFTWVQSDGTTQNLTATQITTIFNDVNQFIQSTFTSLSDVITAIKAGTITTSAGVLSPPSSVTTWPANS